MNDVIRRFYERRLKRLLQRFDGAPLGNDNASKDHVSNKKIIENLRIMKRKLVGAESKDGNKITKVTFHAAQRKIQRDINTAQILKAITEGDSVEAKDDCKIYKKNGVSVIVSKEGHIKTVIYKGKGNKDA